MGIAAWIAVVLMALCLLLIPLGLPGVWLMVAVAGVAVLFGVLGPAVLVPMLVIAAVAEALELLIVKRMSARYGGSNRAFWGALAGGLVGVVVGVPIPVVGSVVAGLIGTFAGAVVGALLESRRPYDSARVAWGTVLARLAAMGVKGIAGFSVLLLAIWRLHGR